jgi:hypothetical protein
VSADRARPQATTSAAAPFPGLTVRVVGTGLSAAVAESGAFQITDVPAGNVQLQFTSDTVNATTAIGNVSGDQFIQIQVQLTPTSAVVVAEEREGKVSLCHIEGNGTYHSISVSESSEATHRAHGDGKVGDPVPGQPLKTFDATCKPAGPSIEIEKSTNGDDADSAPGPEILVGATVTWQYVVTNTGTVPLTAVAVSDDKGVAVNCGGQTSLAPAASMTCTGSGVATLGQYTNLGSVTASWTTATGSGTVTDSDSSHYLGISPEEAEGPKVTLCHKTGAGRYVTIDVSVDAKPAHLAHGDGEVGDAVPGMTGKTFGAGCSVQ